MKNLTFLFVLLVSRSLLAQEGVSLTEHFARERTCDVLHYKVNVDIDEKTKVCRGDVSISFVPLRSSFAFVDFDAAEMAIDRVQLNGQSVEFKHHGDTLTIDLGKEYGLRDTLSVNIHYVVTSPKQGLYFVRPDSGYAKKQWQIYSNGETTENHHWFPCYDFPNDMATSEMIVTVNENWTAISNGKLIDVKKDAKRHKATYHWYEGRPHVSYLISLVAGEYVEVKDSWGTVSLSYYVYKYQKDDAMRSFAKSPKIMDFFSTKIGYPYPWEKYAQSVVQDYFLGGQENVSATTLTDGTIHDARAHLDISSDGLVAHEMAHQWFGDLMTCRDWSHLWLNEGFASYFDILFQEYDKGIEVALKSIYDSQHSVVTSDVGEKRRPSVCSKYVNPSTLFDNRIYGKGACVLHMMRSILGDELFWKAINHYTTKFAFHPVETNDFKIAVEEATGYNLHWFFDEWLYKAGYPEFEVKSKWDNATQSVLVSVTQVQKTDSLTGIFKMPVDIQVWIHDTPIDHRVMVSNANEEFRFPAYQEPQLVLFDKGSTILKKVKCEKSTDEWIFQLRHAEHGVDRIAAIDELRWIVDSAKATEALKLAALEDRLAEVRLNAVWALADAKKTDLSETFLKTYGDNDSKVRSASVTALKNYKGENILGVLQHAFDKDSSYVVAASAMTSLMKSDSLNAKQYARQGLQRDSFREGIRIAALRGLAEVHDDEAFALVKQYTEYGIDRSVRMEALGLMSRKWKEREDVVPYLIQMIDDPSFQVRRASMEMLGNSGSPAGLSPLQRIVDGENDARLVKVSREAIDKIKKAQQEQESH